MSDRDPTELMTALKRFFLIAITILFMCCDRGVAPEIKLPFGEIIASSPFIEGKPAYLESPYVTAGDRTYMVGHQDGSFPEIGWHIKGEMGGIWNHPIKLMDGFDAFLNINGRSIPLEKAKSFTNYPMANLHTYAMDSLGLKIERWQFVPDGREGLAVEYMLYNTGDQDITLDFGFMGHTDLRPTWIGERTGMKDSRDVPDFDPVTGSWVVRDSLNPWYVVFGSSHPVKSFSEGSPKYRGSGASAKLTYELSIPPENARGLRFVVAGSYSSESKAKGTYADILENASGLLAAKKDRYANLASSSKLITPDPVLNQTFEWLKYNSDWLIRDVPEIGRGIAAGIPDYPWWFGVDSEYALQGFMAIGQQEVVYETIRLLDSVSRAVNGNGRIIHEMSTNGAVFNPGNINETPQFATLIWQIYKWGGNREFLRKYFPTVKKGLHWLIEEKDANGNGFPDGFGMMEIHGMDSEMIDVATYTQAAFAHASLMAGELGEEELSQAYIKTAESLKEKINREFWSEEFQSYADFIGTDQQALSLIDDAIVRADTLGKPWAVAELEQTRAEILKNPDPNLKPFVLHHNWVVNTPMEMGIADTEKALKALETARKFINPFGVFVTGIDRDESAGLDEGSFQGSKVFSYTGAVMTLPTGVQAVAENNYGRPEMALDYLSRMSRSFSYALPGSMYEVSPDYGMIAQAWNIYAFAVPVVRQFFGIDPLASEKTTTIKPQMPVSWNQASLEEVRVGENLISVFYRADEQTHLRVSQKEKGWELVLDLGPVREEHLKILSGNPKITVEEGNLIVKGSGEVIEVRYKINP